jgi:DNA-binding transcriptional LysR family regulator
MALWNYNLRHLRAFSKAARLGTMIAASRAVNLSQPAVSQGLSQLEEQLGASLFERRADGLTVLPPADVLLPRVEASLDYIASNRVTSAQARALVALAQGGSYARASEITKLASATLHRSVRDLELALSRKLVEPRGRGVELTARGRTVARRFRLASAEFQSGLDELSRLKGEKEGRVVIGAMPLCRARLLPDAILSFKKEHQGADIAILEGSFAELLEPLRDGEADILIGALRSQDIGKDIEQTPLLEDFPVILARKNHPLTKLGRKTTLVDCQAYSWVMPPKSVPLRAQLDRECANLNLPPPDIEIECGSVIAIRQLLLGTDCLTLLSPDQVAVELQAGWLSIVAHPPKTLARIIGFFNRTDWRPTPLQLEFIESLKISAKSV